MIPTRKAWGASFVAVAVIALSLVGCASTPDMRRNEERGPEQVMGSPPSVDSEDYEFAPPPPHPGVHGRVGEHAHPGVAQATVSDGAVSRADLERFLKLGPSVVFAHVDTEPYREDEKFVGFRVIDASDQALELMSPKLRVGDVVTHINLVRLERPDDYVTIWEELGEAAEVRIDFLRDGEAGQAIWELQ